MLFFYIVDIKGLYFFMFVRRIVSKKDVSKLKNPQNQ